MSPARLTYFNYVSGIGESIRYLLSYAGVEFDDVRVTAGEFAAMKDKLPLGQLPILEYEGKTMFQSVSIARYIANKFNLAGKDDEQKASCDVAVDTIMDIRAILSNYYWVENEEYKALKKDNALKTTRFLVGKVEAYLAKNGGLFLKDGQLSWADIFFAATIDYFNQMAGEDLFANSPTIKALKVKVETQPAISKYLWKRIACTI